MRDTDFSEQRGFVLTHTDYFCLDYRFCLRLFGQSNVMLNEARHSELVSESARQYVNFSRKRKFVFVFGKIPIAYFSYFEIRDVPDLKF